MSGPLIFFIFIVVIDLILKSAKDKQKIEQAKNRRMQELNEKISTPRPMADLKKILSEEIKKERQREISRRPEKSDQRQNTLFNEKRQDKSVIDKKSDVNEISLEISEKEKKILESKKSDTISSQAKMKSNEKNLKKDILKGIIFSQILSEPKSLQNQRRSL